MTIMTLRPEDLALLTDLYELTMAQSYFQEGHNDLATFSLLEEFSRLGDRYKAVREPDRYPVKISSALQNLKRETERELVASEIEPVSERERGLGES